MSYRIWLWCARIAWAVLPVAMGDAIADALTDWSDATATTAAVLAWAAWAITLLALLAPRPWGLTVARLGAAAAVVVAILAGLERGGAGSAVAIIAALVAAGLVLGRAVQDAAANALAYGDEARFPLRTPVPMLLGPVPVAVAIVLAVGAGAPLLIADGRAVAGIAVAVVGGGLATIASRSLHALSRRWLVLVPAGLVVVDPMTLTDPVLVRREHISSLRTSRAVEVAADVLDLRIGTPWGTVVLALDDDVAFGRRHGRGTATMVPARRIALAVVDPARLLAVAGARRIRTTDATRRSGGGHAAAE